LTPERQGLRTLRLIVAGLAAHRMLALLIPDASIESRVVPIVLALVLSFFLLIGYARARPYVAASLGVVALLTLAGGGVLAVRHWWGLPLLLFAPFYAWAAWTFWRSPEVGAYIAYREARRAR